MKYFFLLLLSTAVSSIHITCRFDTGGASFGSCYRCFISAVDFSDGSTHVTTFDGEHLEGYSDEDVCQFYLVYCDQFNIRTFPRGFSKLFPNTRSVVLSQCEITSLIGDELEEFPNLQEFWLVHSNVTRIPGNFFVPTPNIEFIALQLNPFRRVGEGLFDNLEKLYELYFFNNACVDERLSARNPDQIPALVGTIKTYCPDVPPPECQEYFNGVDENLRDENEVLKEQIKNLKSKISKLEEIVKEQELMKK
jgi:hypothetical protein